MTSTDERLERYLHDRSATIDLPHAGVESITRRARRHRRRRTAACGGVAAALLLGGVAAVGLSSDDPPEKVSGPAATSLVDSPLEWSVVDSGAGLGWASSAVSDGSAVYSLSTAAGPEAEGSIGEPRRLYRSTDGTDWEDVGLPEGLFASGVSAGDGSVYAVGTAAAGGDVPNVELAASSDGGAGWDTTAVPLDVGALGDGFPGRVRAVDAEVAAAGGATVVAVSVAGTVDPAQLLDAADDPDTWYQQRGGLTRGAAEGTCTWSEPGASTTVPATTTAPATTTPPEPPATVPPAAPAGAADPSGREAALACESGEAPPAEVRTWAELGLTPEQAALAEGQTHLFVAGPDGALEPVLVQDGASYADARHSNLLAAEDGWWLVTEVARDAGSYATDLVALHSPDGRTWSPTPVTATEGVLATGVVGGRPVLVTIGIPPNEPSGPEQPVQVHRIEPGGTVTTVDVNELVGLPANAGIYAQAVGPLGVAVVLGDGDGGDDVEPTLATSLDGVQWSTQPLPDPEPGTRESISGITITPDAVKVRLNVRDADAPIGVEPPSAQRLFVGTPAG